MILLPCFPFAQLPYQPLQAPQEAKPNLFDHLPQKMHCNEAAFNDFFSKKINEKINTQLSAELHINGEVISTRQPVPGTFLVNVRMFNYHNAIITVTAKLQANNSFYFHARALHPNFGDVLILTREKDKYFFIKSPQTMLMPD